MLEQTPDWLDLAPACYRNITPMAAVELLEKKTKGGRVYVIRQLDGCFYLYQPESRVPRWLSEYMAQNFTAIFDAVSEERGRLYVRVGADQADVITAHRSPWDDKIEAAIAGSGTCRRHQRWRAAGKVQRAPLKSMVRWTLMLNEIVADTNAEDWRFDRMRRQIRELASAIARHRPKSLQEVQAQLEFISTHFDARALPLASRALETAISSLSAINNPRRAHQELRQAA